MLKVVFVVVNYDTSELTMKLYDSLACQTGIGAEYDFKLIIVNNSDNCNETKVLYEFFDSKKNVLLLDCKNNPGYFGGINRGLSVLAEEEKNYVVIGNNDLCFEKNFIAKMFKKKYDKNIFAICPDVITPEGLHQNPHILYRISRFRKLQFDLYFSHYYVGKTLEIIRKLLPKRKNLGINLIEGEIHMGIGACYILTSYFFKKYRQLDCPVFLYGEEAFFSHQIHQSGGILWFDPALKIYHAGSATISKFKKRSAYEFARKGYPLYRSLM
jgi:GT2 family glycosyltransferase